MLSQRGRGLSGSANAGFAGVRKVAVIGCGVDTNIDVDDCNRIAGGVEFAVTRHRTWGMLQMMHGELHVGL